MRPWRRLLGDRRRDDRDRSSVDWLVVGLGNPGPKYEGTRHNVGREVVLEVARRLGVSMDQLKHDSRLVVTSRDGQRVCLATPTLYMNESGRAVGALARFFKVAPESVLVVYDDLDLDMGRLRLRKSGGAGGHNGMRSTISALGTNEFPRLRIGIGRPPPRWDPTDFVLARFDADERAVVDEVVARGADVVEAVVLDGVEAAMNRYN